VAAIAVRKMAGAARLVLAAAAKKLRRETVALGLALRTETMMFPLSLCFFMA
jgi:hypothetical protein